nr:uncharacterized protein si:ch211-261d7.6 isoform X3 [Pseudochaenichthys georgianus]
METPHLKATLIHRLRTPQMSKQDSISCEECGLKFTQWDIYQTHLHQHALEEGEEEEEEEAQMGDDMSPVSELDSVRGVDGKSRDVDISGEADECDTSSLLQIQPTDLLKMCGTPEKGAIWEISYLLSLWEGLYISGFIPETPTAA